MLKELLAITLAASILGATPALGQQASTGAEAVPRMTNSFGAGSKSECPKETHNVAIDPRKVECFAAFSAALPVVPATYAPADPAEVKAVQGLGYNLMTMLNQDGVCSKATKVPRFTACAIIIFNLDPAFRQIGVPRSEQENLPWTYVLKVYRISHMADHRHASIFTVHSDGGEGFYVPGQQWRAIAVQRMSEFCRVRGGKKVGTGISSAGLIPTSCRDESSEPTYVPALLVPWTKAQEFFADQKAIKFHFDAPPHVVEDVEALLPN